MKTAVPALNSHERAEVYWRMAMLNSAFDSVVQRLDELGKTGLLNTRDLKDMLGLTQEVQLEINTTLLNTLESLESDDHAHFGKVRLALERRLRVKP